MSCQACGRAAATKHVVLHQNIGVLVMRFSKSIDANLCKSCITENFWKFTATTLFLGPWGVISLVLTPVFIVNNIVYYIGSLGMEPPDPNAPVLTDQMRKKLAPYAERIAIRLARGEAAETICVDIARLTGTQPDLVATFIQILSKHVDAHRGDASGLPKPMLDKLRPYASRIATRLTRGELPDAVAQDIAGLTQLPVHQVALYVESLGPKA